MHTQILTRIKKLEKIKHIRGNVLQTETDKLDAELKHARLQLQSLPPPQITAKPLPTETPNRRFVPTAGMSGVCNNNSDVAFWAGGDLSSAINTAMNPFAVESRSETGLAPFVVTHGGTIVANRAVIRGTIFATSGVFSGEVTIADGKIQLNKDGSGRLADGNIIWTKDGDLFIAGKFESNKNGNRIIIDPYSRSIQMSDRAGNIISNWSFGESSGSYFAIPILTLTDGQVITSISPHGLQLNQLNYKKFYFTTKGFGVTELNPSSKAVIANFEVGTSSDGVEVLIEGLSTTKPSRSGMLWRDGEVLKIVP